MDDSPDVLSTTDWTWVLGKPCPQCRHDAAAVGVADLLVTAPAIVGKFRTALDTRAAAATRPAAGTWSAAEYGAHLRDACDVCRERLLAMLLHEDPPTPTGTRRRRPSGAGTGASTRAPWPTSFPPRPGTCCGTPPRSARPSWPAPGAAPTVSSSRWAPCSSTSSTNSSTTGGTSA